MKEYGHWDLLQAEKADYSRYKEHHHQLRRRIAMITAVMESFSLPRVYPYPALVSLLIFVLMGTVVSCTPNPGESDRKESLDSSGDYRPFPTVLQYATNFAVEYRESAKLLTVKEPYKGAKTPLHYLLIQRGMVMPQHSDSIKVIEIPIKDYVCTSTTLLPAMEMLQEISGLVGFPSRQYISSEKVLERIRQGAVKELGVDNAMDVERLAALEPDVVFNYTLDGDMKKAEQMERLGIPVVLEAGYLESSPLARAEWIKFIALFFNKEKEADSIFSQIAYKYEAVKAKATKVQQRPTVLSSTVYNDVWYMPGGNSWAATYLEDAGADFLWKDNSESGSIPLSFEAVYEKAAEADLWIGAGNALALEDLLKQESRYGYFRPFKTGEVYTYSKRINASGGNDYFEQGMARPDIVLSDLVRLLHPELLPEHELYFYQKLKK